MYSDVVSTGTAFSVERFKLKTKGDQLQLQEMPSIHTHLKRTQYSVLFIK